MDPKRPRRRSQVRGRIRGGRRPVSNRRMPCSSPGSVRPTRTSPRCCTTSAGSRTPAGGPPRESPRRARPCRSAPPRSATTTSHRGRSRRAGGDPRRHGPPRRAAELLEQALTVFERRLGSEHHEVGVTLGNLGAIDAQRGDLRSAERRLRRALAIKQRTLGVNHPELVPTLGTLGFVCRAQRKRRRRSQALSASAGSARAPGTQRASTLGSTQGQPRALDAPSSHHWRANPAFASLRDVTASGAGVSAKSNTDIRCWLVVMHRVSSFRSLSRTVTCGPPRATRVHEAG